MLYMLKPYRRHSATCKHADKGKAHWTCKCPVWVQGSIGGRAIKQSMDTRSWKVAEERLHNWEVKGKKQVERTVEAVCEEFMQDQEARKMAANTIRNYRKLLTSGTCNSLSTRFAALAVSSISLADLTAWRATWTGAAITQSKAVERLRVFFRWTKDRGYTAEAVADKLKAPKVRTTPTLPFSRDDVAALIGGAANQGQPAEGRRLRAYLMVLRYTGLRRGDAATLPCDSLRGEELLLRQEKTGEPLFTVLPPALVDELRHIERVSERFWFWTGNSSPDIVGGNFGRAFRTLCKKLGIAGRPSLHRLRDTFAVESLNAGVPIEIVSRLLGHTSTKVTHKHYDPWVKSRQEQVKAELGKMWAMDSLALGWEMKGVVQ